MNSELSFWTKEYRKASELNRAVSIINMALERGEEVVLYKDDTGDAGTQLKLTKGDELSVISYNFI